MILATRFTFIVERSWKTRIFRHPKLAWASTTYDVISRNHSNWPSLNISQNVCKGWLNSYWKRQVLVFYPLEKTQKNLIGGKGSSTPPPLPPVRPGVHFAVLEGLLLGKTFIHYAGTDLLQMVGVSSLHIDPSTLLVPLSSESRQKSSSFDAACNSWSTSKLWLNWKQSILCPMLHQ